jgi:iron complex transport system substrate-binding protein
MKISERPAPAGRQVVRICLLLLSLWQVNALAEVSISDDTSKTIRLEKPVTRIISLAPHITELLYAAGAGDRIVGAVEYSDYPAPAQKLVRIGSAAAFDHERIAALKPDLAVVWGSGNPAGQVTQLKRLGIRVFVSEPRRLEDISTTIERLGQLAGTDAVARPAAQAFAARLQALRHRHAASRTVSVFYEIWNQPLMTIGGAHMITAVIELCGGRNVFASLAQPAVTVGLEAVLRSDPQVIIAGGMGDERPEWLDEWKRWPQLSAVKNHHLVFVPPDLLQRHTPRLLEGAERVCQALNQAR